MVVAHGLSCSVTREIGINPVSSALAGRFFTVESLGKPSQFVFGKISCSQGCLMRYSLLKQFWSIPGGTQ